MCTMCDNGCTMCDHVCTMCVMQRRVSRSIPRDVRQSGHQREGSTASNVVRGSTACSPAIAKTSS